MIERMKELVKILNEAAKVYYQGKDEIMSNYEYDKLYDELVALEEKTNITLSSSPTINVGYETLSRLPKENHVEPMLSLDKTKEVSELEAWLNEHLGILSLKLDGLSVILTYENGKLLKALTRGNGEVGEVITNNAKTFKNIPAKIPYKDNLVIRGEALIRYSDFERMNNEYKEISETYKNPRNLCSGSVRQLNNEIAAQRNINFFVYNLIQSQNLEFKTRKEELDWLQEQGFEIVPFKQVNSMNLSQKVEEFSNEIKTCDLPSDGLVLAYDNIAYGKSLGRTAKFPRHSIAFKWRDELADTKIKEIEWSASRTGLINPVAIFDPVELEGTTVSRASLHNISMLKELKIGIGDTVSVYKANMIIPQIFANKTKSNNLIIPNKCPVCGCETQILNENGSVVLTCPNPACYAKQIKALSHFVSRDAMNIEGLSEASLEKFVNMGFIRKFSDIYKLEKYKEEIVEFDGFGEKSYSNLINAINNSKNIQIANLIFALGIKGIGLANAKLIVKKYPYSLNELKNIKYEELVEIEGIGDVLAKSFIEYFNDKENIELKIEYPKKSENNQIFQGINFVITGSLNAFANRNECKEKIESLGGKVTGSVTSKTNYLINNDNTSTSSKNKKAKELNIPIITEEDFLKMLQ